jgi:large subunit ribosomal protein L13
MKTFSPKPKDITRFWYVIDASEASLGRVATKAARLLLGKDKPIFAHHIDCGDSVIIINAEKMVITGNKNLDKNYYRHSGYPGSLKTTNLADMMEDGKSVEVVRKAIRGMLPVNKLRPQRLARLKVYLGSEHQHDAQKPVVISVKETK